MTVAVTIVPAISAETQGLRSGLQDGIYSASWSDRQWVLSTRANGFTINIADET